jgi:hypothetical protein
MEDLHVAAVHNRDRYDAEKMDAGKKKISRSSAISVCCVLP